MGSAMNHTPDDAASEATTHIAVDGIDALRKSAREWALFDVRETAEADAGHIFGATFLPRRMLESRIADLVADRDTPIIVYDDGTSGRAERAAQALRRVGYTDAAVLRGGMAAWTEAGRTPVTGSNVPSKLFGERIHESRHVPRLPVGTLHAWQRAGKDHMVCDIRTPQEYETARIPRAHGAFGVDLALLAADLKRERRPIVVHCAGRTRSIIACQTLRELGVPEVYALENGTMGWRLAGYDLERGPALGVLAPSAGSRDAARTQLDELARSAGVQKVDGETLRRWLAERGAGRSNAYVFDVRQLDEYEAGHIDGTAALPGGLAIQRTDEFIAVRRAPVVFVDDGEARALLTAFWFRQMGWPQVCVLQDGLDGWRAAGHPVRAGRERAWPLGWREAQAVDCITPEALAARRASDEPPVVIDVDTSRHFMAARVPGAAWIPYGWLEHEIARHAATLDTPIVLTCHNGVHSTYAADNLRRMGYRHVGVLTGGTAAWRKANRPVDSGWPANLPAAHDLVVPPYHADEAEMAAYLEWEQQLTASLEQALRQGSA